MLALTELSSFLTFSLAQKYKTLERKLRRSTDMVRRKLVLPSGKAPKFGKSRLSHPQGS